MAALGRDELRNEGKEKQGGLGVEDFRENALTKGARRGGLRCADEQLRISRANHADAEPDKISGARVLDGMKGNGGSGEDCRDAEGGSEYMEKSADKGAERRKDAFAAASSKAARQNVKDSGPRSDCQKQGGGQEKQEMARVEHAEIVRARSAVRKMAPPVVACRL